MNRNNLLRYSISCDIFHVQLSAENALYAEFRFRPKSIE